MNVDKDLNYSFAYVRPCLWLLGIWPDPRIPVGGFRLSSIRSLIVASIMSLYMIVPQVINVFRAWGNVQRTVQYIVAVNIGLMALSKLFATWYHNENLRKLIASVMTDWTNSNEHERNTMLRLSKYGKRYIFKYGAIILITLVGYVFSNILKVYQSSVHQPTRTLIYRFIWFYNVQKSPNYEITFALQLCGGLGTGLINFTIDSFIFMFSLHICGQLINLRVALNKLVDEIADESISSVKFKKGLAVITARHAHLIRNTKIIANCYSVALFVQLLASTFQLCFLTFQFYTILTDKLDLSPINIIYLLIYDIFALMQLHIYCYSAERLLTENNNMAYGVYECKWYNIPAKDAKNLILIAHGSSIPLRLTAGEFGFFSIQMFGAAVKTAMGYVSMLVTLKG